jgi:UDP-glucuronate 4-epimerase
MDFIHEIEIQTGKKAILDLLPLQPGDVYRTWANTEKLQKDYDFRPVVPLSEGVKAFVDWYRSFYLPE